MLGVITAGLFFVLLIWGNLVAGMHAGLACPDWPLCQGSLLPPLHLDVWMEFLHRVLAAVATLLLVVVVRKRLAAYRGWQRAIPILALVLVVLEIGLGALVVLLELPVQPTTIHFMLGLAIFLVVLYLAANDGSSPSAVSFSGYAAALFCITLLVYSQASLGAYLRHSAAGLACPDFPTCRGELIPSYWDMPTITNLSHRLLGVGTLGSVLLLYLASLVDRRLREKRPQFLALAVLVAVQICVGIATVKSGLSYPITSLHLALTLAIIGFSLHLWLSQRTASGSA